MKKFVLSIITLFMLMFSLTGCMAPIIKELTERTPIGIGYKSEEIKKLFDSGEYEKAIEEIDKHLQKYPKDIVALNDKSYALTSLQRDEEAVVVLNDLIQSGAGNDVTFNNLSLAYNNLGLYTLADKYADRGLKIRPKDEYLLINKGNAQHGLEKYAEAMTYFDKALEINDSSSYAVWGKALTYFDQEQYGEALEWFKKYRELGTEDAEDANYYVATALENLKDYEGAIEEYKEQIRLNPEEYYTYISLGSAYTMKGDLQQALASYDKAISMSPAEAEGYYNKSLCLVELDRKDEACDSLERALKIDREYLYYAFDDSGFDPIRDYGKFKDILAKY
jgi:tetratricopeptide (TPR) repeat protein